MIERLPNKDIAKKICKILRDERPDYIYLRDLFRNTRAELNIKVAIQSRRLLNVSTL